MKIKRYNKKYDYSYAFGAYTNLELLENKSVLIHKVIFKKEGLESKDVKKVWKMAKERKIETEINNNLIDKISFKENTYVVGLFDKYLTKIDKKNKHVVLINPSSTGNTGTIIRTMLAFDFQNLAIIKPGVDVFNPKTIRSSMGAFFKINFEYFESFDDYICKFPENKLYSFERDGYIPITKLKEDIGECKTFSLIFGNESKGLSKDLIKASNSVCIPHSKRVESLNLAIAVGITLNSVVNAVDN